MTQPLVIVSSKTGNTRIVAHAVADALPGAILVSADSVPADLAGFDPVILGFWCDRGMAPEDTQAVAARLEGKRLGLFCTLGGDPKAPRAQDWMARTSKALAGEKNTLVATFLCQGRIDPALAARMDAMKAPSPESLARRKAAETHPDRRDREAAAEVFRKAFAA